MAALPEFIADLHTHSTASDGSLSPVELVELASKRGISYLSLTDHDTTGGLAAVASAASQHSVAFIAGIELTTEQIAGELHILGYGIDRESVVLESELARLRQSRLHRLDAMLNRLEAIGITGIQESIDISEPGGSVGRPHIARAMIAAGYVGSIPEAFDRYLANGRPGYVPRESLSGKQAIELIRAAGGLPVIAHPFSYDRLEARLPEFIGYGLAGIEAYYGAYTGTQRERLIALADSYDLLRTGGSDYHGPDAGRSVELGESLVPRICVQQLESRLQTAPPFSAL